MNLYLGMRASNDIFFKPALRYKDSEIVEYIKRS